MSEEQVFADKRFRKKKKNGTYVEVPAPYMEALVADSHAHIHMLADPPLAIGRAGILGVQFICAMTDPVEDGTVLFDNYKQWIRKSMVHAHMLIGGRC